MAMTPEQIKQIELEIDGFGEKAVSLAVSDPELSSHYNRLYRASKMFLKKSAKMALAAKTRDINEKRRAAKAGGSTSTQTPNPGTQQRTSASSSKAN
jgi:hypothetical protein